MIETDFGPDDFDAGDECPVCGCEMEWEHCETCDGEGGSSPYEDDPIQYLPSDWLNCDICRGEGGWLYCPNAKAHPPEPGEEGE